MKQKKTKSPEQGKVNDDVLASLVDWRISIFERDHKGAQYDANCIIDEDIMKTICSIGPLTPEIVKSLLEPTWFWWDEYGTELMTLLCALDIPFVPLSTTKGPTSTSRKRPLPEENAVPSTLETTRPTQQSKRTRPGSSANVSSRTMPMEGYLTFDSSPTVHPPDQSMTAQPFVPVYLPSQGHPPWSYHLPTSSPRNSAFNPYTLQTPAAFTSDHRPLTRMDASPILTLYPSFSSPYHSAVHSPSPFTGHHLHVPPIASLRVPNQTHTPQQQDESEISRINNSHRT